MKNPNPSVYTKEVLFEIYKSLYEANLEGAKESYLDYYKESFSPENLVVEDDESLLDAISHLTEEIYNDTGSEEETIELLYNAGASDELIAMFGFDV